MARQGKVKQEQSTAKERRTSLLLGTPITVTGTVDSQAASSSQASLAGHSSTTDRFTEADGWDTIRSMLFSRVPRMSMDSLIHAAYLHRGIQTYLHEARRQAVQRAKLHGNREAEIIEFIHNAWHRDDSEEDELNETVDDVIGIMASLRAASSDLFEPLTQLECEARIFQERFDKEMARMAFGGKTEKQT